MGRSFGFLLTAVFFASVSFRANALDCNAVCPARPIGLMETGMGAPYIVSPPKVPPKFTGCQIAWDEDSKKRFVVTFRDGRIQKYEGFGLPFGPFKCLYQDNILAPGSDGPCTYFPTESILGGLVSTPVDESQLNWPRGQCFPIVKSGARQQSAAANRKSEKLFSTIDDMLDDSRSAPRDARDLVNNALGLIESVITRDPDDPLMQLAMGRASIIRDCAQRGNNCSIRAKGHLTKAAQLDPKLVRAHVLLAHDAMNGGCIPCAMPHISKAQQIDSTSPYVLEVRGRHAQLSGYGDPEKFYLDAIKAFPTSKKRWQAFTWLADIYKERDDYERAELALRNAVEAAPEGAWSQGNLGGFYIFARGDYEKAIPVLRKALSIMDFGVAREGLALSLYERWGDAHLKKARPDVIALHWKDAQAEFADTLSMFFISANYAGTGRAARALLESKRVPDSVLDQAWDRGRTPLLTALYNDNTDLAVFLINRGANPNARDAYGKYAVHLAAGYANYRVMEELTTKGANLQALTQQDRFTTLIEAARAGTRRPDRLKVAGLLIDKGVSLEAKTPQGATALSLAISVRDREMVRYLLERGAQPNTDIFEGMTPAVWAVRMGDLGVLQELARKNANLDITFSGMKLPEFAEKYGQPEIAKWLRERPASL